MKMQHEFRGQIDCIIAHCINLIFPQAIVYAYYIFNTKEALVIAGSLVFIAETYGNHSLCTGITIFGEEK